MTKKSSSRDLQSQVLSEKLSFLNKWRIAGLDFDVRRMFKTMFHETLVITLFGLIVVVTGIFAKPPVDCPCIQALIVPMAFVGMVVISRQVEGHFASFLLSPLDQYNIYNPLREKPSFRRVHRIVHNIAFLALLCLMNAAQSIGRISELRSRQDEIYASLQTSDKLYLSLLPLAWLNFTQKFTGTCALITLTRLAMDLFIQSISFVSGCSFENKIERKKSCLKNHHGMKNASDINSNCSYYDNNPFGGPQPVRELISEYSSSRK